MQRCKLIIAYRNSKVSTKSVPFLPQFFLRKVPKKFRSKFRNFLRNLSKIIDKLYSKVYNEVKETNLQGGARHKNQLQKAMDIAD